ncbi:MAG: hypothetical protein ACLSU0_06045 [Oscillospiraceae bacterium]
MAVATPVIERRTYNQSIESEARSAGMTADELHNARMKDNLARLLNPENKIKDVVASIDADGTQVIQAAPEAVQAPERSVAPSVVYGADGIIARPASAVQTPAAEAPAYAPAHSAAQPVYVVKNARANADIFRADSPVNRPAQAYASTPAQAYEAARAMAAANAAPATEEEENEDLRPTPTTIQYQTIGADGTVIINSAARTMQEGEIARPAEREEPAKISLTKRDKVIIGVIVSLILAVFVLIIVNSAIISGLNSEIAAYEGMVSDVQSQYAAVAEDLEELTSYDNIYNVAIENGWITG